MSAVPAPDGVPVKGSNSGSYLNSSPRALSPKKTASHAKSKITSLIRNATTTTALPEVPEVLHIPEEIEPETPTPHLAQSLKAKCSTLVRKISSTLSDLFDPNKP